MIFSRQVSGGSALGEGWDTLSLLICAVMSAGGILVAFVVKHTDSIAKTITVAFSVAVTAVVEFVFMGGQMTLSMMVGVICTILATLNYGLDSTPPQPGPITTSPRDTVAERPLLSKDQDARGEDSTSRDEEAQLAIGVSEEERRRDYEEE